MLRGKLICLLSLVIFLSATANSISIGSGFTFNAVNNPADSEDSTLSGLLFGVHVNFPESFTGTISFSWSFFILGDFPLQRQVSRSRSEGALQRLKLTAVAPKMSQSCNGSRPSNLVKSLLGSSSWDTKSSRLATVFGTSSTYFIHESSPRSSLTDVIFFSSSPRLLISGHSSRH